MWLIPAYEHKAYVFMTTQSAATLYPMQRKGPATVFIDSYLISFLLTLGWYICNGWSSLQMDWCKVVDSFTRFIADQFILLCQGIDHSIINNIRGRQYTLAPNAQFQIIELPCGQWWKKYSDIVEIPKCRNTPLQVRIMHSKC